MDDTTHPFFVEDGASRQDTAVLLLAAAEENDIDARAVRAVRGGYRISQSLADVLYAESKQASKPAAPSPPAEPKKPSRARKTSKTAEPEPEPAPEAHPENEE